MGSANQLDETVEVRDRVARHAQAFEVDPLLVTIRLFNQAANEIRTGWQPALPLEIAFVSAVSQFTRNTGIDAEEAVSVKQTKTMAKKSGQLPGVTQKESVSPSSETETIKKPSTKPVDEESAAVYDRIHEGWEEIIGLMDQRSRHTAALLRSGRLLGMRRGVLILGFEGNILKQKMENEENMDLTQSVVSDYAGRRVIVRCLALKDRQSEIPADVDIDGMVAAALRDLGGKIVDVQ
jgi:DNA polymerase-3 subunit gamma/tau